MIQARNRGQRVALGMGWDGSGQGKGGHKSWVSNLTGQQRLDYDDKVLQSTYAERTPEDLAGWVAESNPIIDLFGVNDLKSIGRKGGGHSQLYTNTYDPSDFASLKRRAGDGGTKTDLDFLELNQDYLNQYNVKNNTNYSAEDVDRMSKRAQELQYLRFGPEKDSFVDKYGLPIALGGVALATGGIAGLYGGAAGTGTSAATGAAGTGTSAGTVGTITGAEALAGGAGAGAGAGYTLPGVASTGGSLLGTAGSVAGAVGAGSQLYNGKEIYDDVSPILGTVKDIYGKGKEIYDGVSPIIDTVTDVVGGVTGLETQDDIENILIEGQREAADLVRPYAERGSKYSDRIDQLIGAAPDYGDAIATEVGRGDFTMEDFQADPGYQFRKEQGQQALDRKLAAMGMDRSGAAVKEGIRYNQGIADQAYGDAYNRHYDERDRRYDLLTGERGRIDNLLAGQQNIGVDATGNLANILMGEAGVGAMSKSKKQEVLNSLLSLLG